MSAIPPPIATGPAAARATPWLTGMLAALATISSLGGVLGEHTLYARNLPYLTAQVWTQDLTILILLVPVLLVSFRRARRGSAAATAMWLGTVTFLSYVYAFYGMTLHFSQMFLVHCLALGVAGYLLLIALLSVDVAGLRDGFWWHTWRTPAVVFLTSPR